MKKKDNIKLVHDENNKNAFSKTEIITIFISAIALLIAGVSLWITYNTFAYERKFQSLEKRTEKLYKLAKVSQNLESNINFLKTLDLW